MSNATDARSRYEGISGTRASRPPTQFYDPSGSNVDRRPGAADLRFQMAGIVYELSAAVTGVVRFLFSKRNVFLPTGTRVVFQLEQKLRLVPATDSPIRILTGGDNAEKRNDKAGSTGQEKGGKQ